MRKFKKFNFWSIFDNFSNIYEVKITFFKKLVEQAPATYLKFDVFWIYMLWGLNPNLRSRGNARILSDSIPIIWLSTDTSAVCVDDVQILGMESEIL
jgi:hypothetical protein